MVGFNGVSTLVFVVDFFVALLLWDYGTKHPTKAIALRTALCTVSTSSLSLVWSLT